MLQNILQINRGFGLWYKIFYEEVEHFKICLKMTFKIQVQFDLLYCLSQLI